MLVYTLLWNSCLNFYNPCLTFLVVSTIDSSSLLGCLFSKFSIYHLWINIFIQNFVLIWVNLLICHLYEVDYFSWFVGCYESWEVIRIYRYSFFENNLVQDHHTYSSHICTTKLIKLGIVLELNPIYLTIFIE